MKKKLFLKSMLLLFALIVGSSSVWATDPDVTYDFTGSDWSVSDGTLSNGTVSFTGAGGANFKMNSGYFMIGKSGAYLNFPTYSNAVEKIVVTGNSGASASTKMNIYVDDTAVSEETTGSTGVNEYVINSSYQAAGTQYTLKVTSSHNAQITKIEIYYASGGGGSTMTVTYNGNGNTSGSVPEDSNEYEDGDEVTVLGNTGSLAKDHYSFGGWNTKADGTGTGYVAGNTFTISASTTLYAQWTANTHTVTLPANNSYGEYTMSASNPVAYGTEVELTYTPATGYETYVATWSVNGEPISGNKFTMPDENVTVTVSVEEYEQPTEVTVTFNNEFLGTDAGGRIDKKTTKTQDNISFIFDKPSGANWPQGDAGVIRIYQGTTLEIVAPAGYVITNITFTANGDWKSGMTADVGTYSDTKDSDNKTYWTGFANDITFSPAGTHRIATVYVELSQTVDIIITDAGWASFSCQSEVAIPAGVTAYYASASDGSTTVTLTEITGDFIPANTGVVVSGSEGTYSANVTATSASLGGTNLLKPNLKPTALTADYYTLAADGGNPVFKKSTGEGNLAAGKAYLDLGSSAPVLAIDFGGSTGIDEVRSQMNVNGEVYNLNGQRVAQPTKGLYIVNGKKYVIK